MSATLAPVILVPLAGAVLGYLLEERMRRYLAGLTALIVLACTALLAAALWNHGPIVYHLGGWAPPLGISLHVDGFSIFMLSMTAIVGCFITFFGVAYYGPNNPEAVSTSEQRLFWPLWFSLWAALNALFVAADIFNTYVIFEVMGLAAIALITLAGKAEALIAAMRYLIAAFLGSMSYLLGVALLYAQYGMLDFSLLGEAVQGSPASRAAFALMVVGLMLKTALFPLHFWLPPAHANASPPVSAILSALVIKGSFFVLVRLWFGVFAGTGLAGAGQILGILGCIAILWGSFEALRQRRLKLLIAHSTVAQVGYIFLLFPLTGILYDSGGEVHAAWLNEASAGVMYQVVSHALAKSAMFLAAGIIIGAYGSDQLQVLSGLSRDLPLTSFTLALAGMSLTGLPPSGGFAAKFLIMKAALLSGQWWWLPVIVLGGLMTAAYVALILRYAFQSAETSADKRPVPQSMEVIALLLAVLSVVIGFRLEEPLELLSVGSPFPFDQGGGGER
jgi:multicomponent Na+:H+ antiporter subunit D